jgi:hypothetical protein
MAAPNQLQMSENQRAMLDLAYACDLKVSDASEHPAINARRAQIKTQADAVAYIRGVEQKIHSRRQVRELPATRTGGPADIHHS